MSVSLKVTILGCGGSQGVPTATGYWGACNPEDSRNRRLRASVLVEKQDAQGEWRRLLIDTSPDFRRQMLDNGVTRIDAVLFTHAHADHLHGIDDLRAFNRSQGEIIPIYADAATLHDIRTRFEYTVAANKAAIFYKPTLAPNLIDGPFQAAGIDVVPFVQDHGFIKSLGFRIGAFAYTTDAVRLDEAALETLRGVDTWIVDCLRIEPPHPTHADLTTTLGWIERVRPRRAILTHMDVEMDFARLAALLPPGVEPATDRLVLEI